MSSGAFHTYTVLLAVSLAIPSNAVSQEEVTHEADSANTGALHLDLGGEWTSAYYFRGLLQEDSGFIFQDWLDLGIDLAEGEDESWSLSATVGIWNSMHDNKTDAGTTDSFVAKWYECDLYGGLTLDVEDWSFDATYLVYTSPSDAFSTIGELDLSASYDDSGLWDDNFALNPHVLVAFETDDKGGSEDSYLEFGIEPECSHQLNDEITIDFSFPVTVGFNLDDYYVKNDGRNDAFGYVEFGVDASTALPVPNRFGSWSLNAGVHALSLGDAARDANNGNEFEVVGRVGISISY